MQTPGLPAPHPSSSRNAADNFFSGKPSQAKEHFGDVMNRALYSGAGVPPVRTRTHGQDTPATTDRDTTEHGAQARPSQPHHSSFANDLDAKSDDSTEKPDTDRKHTTHTRKSEKSAAPVNNSFIGVTVPSIPTPTPTPAKPTGNSHESPQTDDPVTPLPADATNITVKNADPSEPEPEADDSTAKPVPAGMKPHSAETDGSIEHAQNPPTADSAKAIETQAAEIDADAAKPTVSDDSGSPLTQIAESKGTAQSLSASPANPHGIPAAKQDMTMKKAEKMQKVAGPGEQDLPGNSATGSEELPKGQKIAQKAASHGEKADSTPIELPTRVSTSATTPSATITSAAPAAPANIETRVLERTHDIVALHAMRLTDTGADSLHVVVKPGGGIQISLELRQSARGIEVSASLHKGDYDQLSQHWPDLQQRLEARGVRVGTLTPSENYTGANHQFHQSKQQSSQQESLHAGAFAEFALAGSITEAPAARAARASAYRGWETWA